MAGVFNKFVHPGTVKQGYLVKSPPLDKKLKLDGWRKRWCVFTIIEGDPSLDYYKDEEQAFNSLPIKRISLLNCYQVISDMTHKQKKHIFALHLPKRVYYFSAPSHVEMLDWVDAFCTNLKLSHTDGGTMPGTPPASKLMLDNRSATMPAAHSLSATSPIVLPRSRTPDSPLPPIPRSPDILIRPPPPGFPIPPTPLDVSSTNSYPNVSPRSSPLPRTRSIHSLTGGKENGVLSEGAKISISINPPPALPPHRKNAKSSSDEEEDDDDDDPLSPPTPPPRRLSPIPMSSPPIALGFDMDGDSPPAPPPRIVGGSPLHSVT
ncbi:uncharacterized protein LOC135331633 isoform X2 [Halichondria panicea]|uniref:uncharacterized protein LOC135331633 isoform X2 n=1 Tax=Halichondria panicea TaxID=6063 RepID=UPI00312BBE0C